MVTIICICYFLCLREHLKDNFSETNCWTEECIRLYFNKFWHGVVPLIFPPTTYQRKCFPLTSPISVAEHLRMFGNLKAEKCYLSRVSFTLHFLLKKLSK